MRAKNLPKGLALLAALLTPGVPGVGNVVRAQGTPASVSKPSTPLKNPLEGNASAIRAGGARFQAVCAECHGFDGKGIFGPDLTTLWLTGAADDRVFQTVRNGVPGSSMPPNRLGDDEIWGVLAYLRTLAPKVPPAPATGDAAAGERLFRVNCASCHRVSGRGGRLGPDLSRIGSGRSRDGLIRDIRNASAVIVPGYRTVTLVLTDGQAVRGAVKGEDAFSIRIMDAAEQLRGYVKSSLKDVVPSPTSLMPDFDENRLSGHDLDDLLKYLSTLRLAPTGP